MLKYWYLEGVKFNSSYVKTDWVSYKMLVFSPHPVFQDTDLLSPGIVVNSISPSSPTLEGSRHLSRSNIDIPRSSGPDDPKRQLPRKRSDSSTYELDTIKHHQAFLSRWIVKRSQTVPSEQLPVNLILLICARLCADSATVAVFTCCFDSSCEQWMFCLWSVSTPAFSTGSRGHDDRATAPCWKEAPWESLTLRWQTSSCSALLWGWCSHWGRLLCPH